MRLITLVFYFLVGYLLWRLVRSMLRGFTSPPSAPPPEASSPKEGTASKDKVFRDGEIKDAEFEDITPTADASSKNTTR